MSTQQLKLRQPKVALFYLLAAILQIFVVLYPFGSLLGSYVSEALFLFLLTMTFSYYGQDINQLAQRSLVLPLVFLLPTATLLQHHIAGLGVRYIHETVTAVMIQGHFLYFFSVVVALLLHYALINQQGKPSHDQLMSGILRALLRLLVATVVAVAIYSPLWLLLDLLAPQLSLSWMGLKPGNVMLFMPAFNLSFWGLSAYPKWLKRLEDLLLQYWHWLLSSYLLMTLYFMVINLVGIVQLRLAFWLCWAIVGLLIWHLAIFVGGHKPKVQQMLYRLRFAPVVVFFPLTMVFLDLYYQFGTRYFGQYCPSFIHYFGINHSNIIPLFYTFVLWLTTIHLSVFSVAVRDSRISKFSKQFQSFPYFFVLVVMVAVLNPWGWQRLSRPYYTDCFVYKDEQTLYQHFSTPRQSLFVSRALDQLAQFFMNGSAMSWHVRGYGNTALPIAMLPPLDKQPLGAVCRVNLGIEYLPGLVEGGQCSVILGGAIERDAPHEVLVSYRRPNNLVWLPFSSAFPNLHFQTAHYIAVPVYSGFGLSMYGYCAAKVQQKWRAGLLVDKACWLTVAGQAVAVKPEKILGVRHTVGDQRILQKPPLLRRLPGR